MRHYQDKAIAGNEIRQWFEATSDENFCILPPSHLSIRSGNFSTAREIVYLTKPSCAAHLGLFSSATVNLRSLPLIGRYGFPSDSDLTWLAHGNRKLNIYFVGDADPADMLIFLYLTSNLDATLFWSGVRDEIIRIPVGKQFVLPLSVSELGAVAQFPSLDSQCKFLIGSTLMDFLNEQNKLELEGFVNSQRSP